MLLLALGLLAAAAPPPATPHPAAVQAALVARGDEAFASRGDPARLAEAIDSYGRAAALHPGDAGTEIRLARAQAFRALAEPDVAREAWVASSRAAERALRKLSPGWAAAVDAGDLAGAPARVGPEGAVALYWLALATWSSAQSKGLAALLAVKDPALAAMERAAALDGAADCAGPHRALGAWTAALPAAVGGGVARSRRHFEEAHLRGAGCLLNRVREAETLIVLFQDRAAFEKALAEVEAAADTDPLWAPENQVARRLARDLRGFSNARWWLTDLASPLLLKYLGRRWQPKLAAGNAPFRFGPAEGTAFFAPFGWREAEFRSTWDESWRLNRTMPGARFWKFLSLFQSKRRKQGLRRMSGIALLEAAPGESRTKGAEE